jgi:hypothetical protein
LERVKLDKLTLVAKAMAGSTLVGEGVPMTSNNKNSVNGLVLFMNFFIYTRPNFILCRIPQFTTQNRTKQNNGTNKDGKRTNPTPGVDFKP